MSEAEKAKVLRRAKIVTFVVLVVLAIGAGRTVMSRASNAKALEAGSAEQAKLYVKVATPKVGGAASTIELPGSLQGAMQSPIAARTSGYLKRWTHDIGSRVNKGDLLAEIENPEIDQQI